MSRNGGFIYIDNGDTFLGSRLAERLDTQGKFTDVVSVGDWHLGKRAIGFLSFDKRTIEAISLAEQYGLVVTGRYGVRFSHPQWFKPLAFKEILENTPANVRSVLQAVLASPNGKAVPPGTWNALIKVVSELRPDLNPHLAYLEELVNNLKIQLSGEGFEVLAEEKDGYELIVRAAGFEEEAGQTITYWRQNTVDTTNYGTSNSNSFIASMSPHSNTFTEVILMEDRVIENDVRFVSEWSSVNSYVTGENVFIKDNQVLSVANVNRHAVEHTLGVDVIYYQHSYRSFVLVQYKRMKKDDDGVLRYRPDKSFFTEIDKMYEFRKNHPIPVTPISELSEFRLNEDAFFFKFHDGVDFLPLQTGLSKGMYVPIQYWENFTKQPASKGPNGGLNVTYDNIGRYLTNTDFIALVKRGWIGSRTTTTAAIESIVQDLIAMGHSVVVGIKQDIKTA